MRAFPATFIYFKNNAFQCKDECIYSITFAFDSDQWEMDEIGQSVVFMLKYKDIDNHLGVSIRALKLYNAVVVYTKIDSKFKLIKAKLTKYPTTKGMDIKNKKWYTLVFTIKGNNFIVNFKKSYDQNLKIFKGPIAGLFKMGGGSFGIGTNKTAAAFERISLSTIFVRKKKYESKEEKDSEEIDPSAALAFGGDLPNSLAGNTGGMSARKEYEIKQTATSMGSNVQISTDKKGGVSYAIAKVGLTKKQDISTSTC